MRRSLLVIGLAYAFAARAAAAFVSPRLAVPVVSPSRASCSTVRVRAGGVEGVPSSGALQDLHDSVFESLRSSLSLEASDYCDTMGLAQWEAQGYSGRMWGYKGNNKLTWVSRGVTVSDGAVFDAEATVWVGPLTEVPNLYFRVGATVEEVSVELDYYPRDDAAYTTGNNYLQDYYLDSEAVRLYEDAVGDREVVARPYPWNVKARAIMSPLALHLVLPNNDQSVEKVSALTKAYVDRWSSWFSSAKEVNRMKRGQMLSRDTAVRRLWFEARANDYAYMLGGDEELGRKLAAAISGPQQAAYTGQAS